MSPCVLKAKPWVIPFSAFPRATAAVAAAVAATLTIGAETSGTVAAAQGQLPGPAPMAGASAAAPIFVGLAPVRHRLRKDELARTDLHMRLYVLQLCKRKGGPVVDLVLTF
jgi:hypothetical protein